MDPDDDNDDEIIVNSMETAAHEAALEDGVLIPGSLKEPGPLKGKKSGLRRGKWTAEEEAFASRLVQDFKCGLLPLADGTTLRTFLSKILNCDPMRISKKFVGQKSIGKQIYRRRDVSKDFMDQNQAEIAELEQKFIDRVTQVYNAKLAAIRKDPYRERPPEPPEEHFSDPEPAVDGGNSTWNDSCNQFSKATTSSYMTTQEQAYRALKSNVKMEGVNQDYLRMLSMNSSYGVGGSGGNMFGNLPLPYSATAAEGEEAAVGMMHQSGSLDMIYATMDRQMSPGPFSPAGNSSAGQSFNWLNPHASLLPSYAGGNSNATFPTLFAAAGGASQAMMNAGASVDSKASFSAPDAGDWPSMNNLVAAAETIENFEQQRRNSLGRSSSAGDANFIFGSMSSLNNVRLVSAPAMTNVAGSDTMPTITGAKLSNSNLQNAGIGDCTAPPALRLQRNLSSETDRSVEDIGYPIDDASPFPRRPPVADSMKAQAPSEEAKNQGGDVRARAGSSASSASAQSAINKSNFLTDGDGRFSPRTAAAAALVAMPQHQYAPYISPPMVIPENSERTLDEAKGQEPQLPRDSSVNDFWMLVKCGDIPQPDQGVLSEVIRFNVAKSRAAALAAGASAEESSSSPTMGASVMPISQKKKPPPIVTNYSPLPASIVRQKISPNLLPPHLAKQREMEELLKPVRDGSSSNTEVDDEDEELLPSSKSTSRHSLDGEKIAGSSGSSSAALIPMAQVVSDNEPSVDPLLSYSTSIDANDEFRPAKKQRV